jgi:hypothetical protein
MGITGLLQRGHGIADGALEADKIRYWLGGIRHHSFPTTLEEPISVFRRGRPGIGWAECR